MNTLRDQTFYCEQRRAVSSGILETAGGTFLLLIAVREYQASASMKSVLAAGPNAGMIFSLLLVPWVARMRWSLTGAASTMCVLGGMGYAIAALFPSWEIFLGGTFAALFLASTVVPLMTQVYQNNYHPKERGQLFSRGNLLRIIGAALFSYVAGHYLSGGMERFPVLLAIYALALFSAGYYLWRCPSVAFHDDASTRPFAAFRHVRQDPRFRSTLTSWMILGLGNLMMMPLRVEYLANPAHGLHLSAEQIALLMGVLPNLARLALSRAWGWLFDHVNFFGLRLALNLCFVVGGLAFFTGDELPQLIIGSLLYGVAFAGGDVAWSLWVTKLAPPRHVAEYMSVHTFFTGCRGVVAPWLGFGMLAHWGIIPTALVSMGMILVASLMLIPEIRNARKEAWMAGEEGESR